MIKIIRDMCKLYVLTLLVALMQISCNNQTPSADSTSKKRDTGVSNNKKVTDEKNEKTSNAKPFEPKKLKYTHELVNDCTIVLHQKDYNLKITLNLDRPLSDHVTAAGYYKMKVKIKENLIFSEMNIDDPGYYMFSLNDHEWPKLIKGSNYFYMFCDKYYGEPEGSSYYGYKFNSDTLVKYVPDITDVEIPVDSLIRLTNNK